MRVMDIGANVGLYSVIADQCVGPTGSVWAFEPSSESFARLQRNLSLNRVQSVTTTKVALSEKSSGKAVLKRDALHADGDRYLDLQGQPSSPPAGGEAGDAEVVEILTLDEWVAGQPLARERVDFIKMDIEGGEFSVFKGARETLLRNRDIVLMFECNRKTCARFGPHPARMCLNFSATSRTCGWPAGTPKPNSGMSRRNNCYPSAISGPPAILTRLPSGVS